MNNGIESSRTDVERDEFHRLTKIVVTINVLFFKESATSSMVSTYFFVMLIPVDAVHVPICRD
jgi:hypothetical protein